MLVDENRLLSRVKNFSAIFQPDFSLLPDIDIGSVLSAKISSISVIEQAEELFDVHDGRASIMAAACKYLNISPVFIKI